MRPHPHSDPLSSLTLKRNLTSHRLCKEVMGDMHSKDAAVYIQTQILVSVPQRLVKPAIFCRVKANASPDRSVVVLQGPPLTSRLFSTTFRTPKGTITGA